MKNILLSFLSSSSGEGAGGLETGVCENEVELASSGEIPGGLESGDCESAVKLALFFAIGVLEPSRGVSHSDASCRGAGTGSVAERRMLLHPSASLLAVGARLRNSA